LSALLICGFRLGLRSCRRDGRQRDDSRRSWGVELEDPRSGLTEQLQSLPELRVDSVLSPPKVQQYAASHSPFLDAGTWPQTLAPPFPPRLLSRPALPCRPYPAARAMPSRTRSTPTAPAFRPTDREPGAMDPLSGSKCHRKLSVSLSRMTWAVDLDLAHGGIPLGMPPKVT
jgi:hypothetical protein